MSQCRLMLEVTGMTKRYLIFSWNRETLKLFVVLEKTTWRWVFK